MQPRRRSTHCTRRQNIIMYARKLIYNDEVLWSQNLGFIAIANYTFIVDTYHQIHIN